MKRLMSGAFLLAMLSTPSFALADVAPPKIKAKVAFIDIERCLFETEEGLRLKATLKKMVDKRQSAVSAVEEKLAGQVKKLQELEKEKGRTNPVFMQAVISHESDVNKFREYANRIQLDLKQKEEEMRRPMELKLQKILDRMGAAEGYDLIIDKKSLPSSRSSLDLTEKVIKEYNWGPSTT